jgi:hypothetical protein
MEGRLAASPPAAALKLIGYNTNQSPRREFLEITREDCYADGVGADGRE